MRLCGSLAPVGGPRWRVIASLLLCLAVAEYSRGGSTETMSGEGVFEKASPAVVSVVVTAEGGLVKQASGFLVSDDGLIATNYHVIKDGRSAEVTLPSLAKLVVKGVVASNPHWDLAILRVEGKSLPFLKIAKDDPKIGAKVYAIGNPRGLTNTLSEGLLSGVRQVDRVLSLLQTTAAISAGSSGGPLLADNGEVVGITTASLVTGQNLNFAVPGKLLLSLLSKVGEPITLSKVPWPTPTSAPAGGDSITATRRTFASFADLVGAIPEDILPAPSRDRPVARRPKDASGQSSPSQWSDLQTGLLTKWMKDLAGSTVTLCATMRPDDLPNALFVENDKVVARFSEEVKPRQDLTLAFTVTAEFDLEKGKALTQIRPGSKVLINGTVHSLWATRRSIVVFGLARGSSVELSIGSPDAPAVILNLRDCAIQQATDTARSGKPEAPTNATPRILPREGQASSRIALAKVYLDAGMKKKALEILRNVIAHFPETKAAVQAQQEIERLLPDTSKKE